MSKPLFNTFKNRFGQNVPMCATIENSEEVRNYLKETYKFPYQNSVNWIKSDNPYLVVSFSPSRMGNIYMSIYTMSEDDISRYDLSTVKDFVEFNQFKKYVNWAYRLPRNIVNQK